MSGNWYSIETGQFGYPQPENNYFEQTYKPETGCPTCKVGKVQANPFRFRAEPKARHSQFLGLNWVFDQMFVREPVKVEFEKEKVLGIRFTRPVLNKTGKPLETMYQLHVDTVLPEGLIKGNLTTETCQMPTDKRSIRFLEAMGSDLLKGPFCGHVKFNFPIGESLRFKESIFRGQPDIVRTNEWFGSGGVANRPILISERVKNIIEKNKWRGAFTKIVELIA
ncbi:hypothetical protein ACMA1I_16145 [Pontibacter sp. 13R65]|uniref:hypothetical protein n=1 Tax=Pontibacter sp. 13R65 TaxID=3127458 RepID=UPI00301C6C69